MSESEEEKLLDVLMILTDDSSFKILEILLKDYLLSQIHFAIKEP